MSTQNKDDFYIGYLPKAPQSVAKVITRAILLLVVLAIILAVGLAFSQKKLQSNNFEFGKTTEITGVLLTAPVPNLVVHNGKDIHGNDLYQSIILVGLGKFGADSLVHYFQEKINQPLAQSKVTLNGTLIYSDGKTLLELTDEENALVKAERLDSTFEAPLQELGEIEVVGEIIDSKCYFGVMNPGYGKPHRSCAIRCVSGGIPPVVWSETETGTTDYYILLGKEGNAIHQKVLPYVADQSCIKGKVYQYFDWKVLYADENIKSRGCSVQ